MSLKVNMDVVAAALQVSARSVAVAVPVTVIHYEGGPLLLSPSRVLEGQDNLL